MINKKTVAAILGACAVVAAVVSFIANTATIIQFTNQLIGRNEPAIVVAGPSETARPATGELPSSASSLSTITSTPPSEPTSKAPVAPADPPIIPTTKPMPPSVPQGQAQPSVPNKFHGKWFGQVYQDGSSPYPYSVELTISDGGGGQQIGTVAYASLRCGGIWVLEAAWDNKIKATEQIKYGGGCVKTLTIELLMQPDGQVFYSFRDTAGTGVLRRLS